MESNYDKIMVEDLMSIRHRFSTDLKHVEDWSQRARELYESGNAEASFELFMRAALNDHPMAQYMVGIMYLDGYGTEEDVKKTLYWLNKAADLYVPQAPRTLGLLYLRGDRVVRNVGAGTCLIEASAMIGDPEGQFFHHLILTASDRKEEALKFLTGSSERGYPPAMDRLGWMHLTGMHPEPDREKGMELLRTAAQKGNPKAMVHLAIALLDEDSNKAEAMRLCRESAAAGETLGMTTLGILISEGCTVTPNAEVGARWIRLAAQKGDPRAMRCLGEYIRDGKAAPEDGEDAEFWFRKAEDTDTKSSPI